MTVLVSKEIEELSQTQQLIADFHKSNLEGASYDLRLGDQYIKGGVSKALSTSSPSLVLSPGEFALLSSREKLCFPLNLIGHNGLTSPWGRKGLVSLFSPQIDPGFKGVLFVPVFNAGDTDIVLTRNDKIFTVEFVRTNADAEWGWSERHGEQNDISARDNFPKILKANFSDIRSANRKIDASMQRIALLEHNIEGLEKRLSDASSGKANTTALTVAVIALLVSIFLAFSSSGGGGGALAKAGSPQTLDAQHSTRSSTK